MPYEYDVFLSYPRAGQIRRWVQRVFYPELVEWLDYNMARKPRIFIDEEIPTGVQWPPHLKTALLESRCLVAVWATPYFRSRWCLAEWQSMLLREQAIDIDPGHDHGLVYPVVFADGDRFPTPAKTTQHKRGFSRFNTLRPGHDESELFQEFRLHIQELCEELALWLNEAPDWQADWPIVEPDEQEPPAMPFPEL